MTNVPIEHFLKPISLIVFLFFAMVFIILSVILNYHWTNYEVTKEKLEKVRFWYFTISWTLILLMIACLIAINI